MAIKSSEIPFVMGQKVTANIRGENFAVCVRGWMKGQYVIIDLPKVGGGKLPGCSSNRSANPFHQRWLVCQLQVFDQRSLGSAQWDFDH